MPASELDHPMPPSRVGQTLNGKYRLERLLGVGGMATVYAATHRNRKRFAIKVLHPELSLRDDLRGRFVREGYVANTVEHPGAVSVIDDDVTEDGLVFIVMELLEGKSLEALWCDNGGVLPVPLVLALGRQVLEVLGAAHRRGIVHRDVKPDNLFVTDDGRVKVLDFGIARLRSEAATSQKLTVTGATLGTPAFMAPEQALGDAAQIDARSDLWSVGATLFVLISGELVHDGGTPQKLMIQAATQPARPLSSVAPSVPAVVQGVVDRALSFAKSERYASAEEMADALERAHREAFSSPLDAAPPSIARRIAGLRSEARAVTRRGASDGVARGGRARSPEGPRADAAARPSHPERGAVDGPDVSSAEASRRPAPSGAEGADGGAGNAGSAAEAARPAPLPPGAGADHRGEDERASERTARPGIVATPAGVAAAHVHVNIGSASQDTGSARLGWFIALVALAALVAVLLLTVRQVEYASQPPMPEPRPMAPAVRAAESAAPRSATPPPVAGGAPTTPAAPAETRGEAPDEAPEPATLRKAASPAQTRATASEPERGIGSREPGGDGPTGSPAPRKPARPASSPAVWSGCSRLLERQSLGMKLTDAEKAELARRCKK